MQWLSNCLKMQSMINWGHVIFIYFKRIFNLFCKIDKETKYLECHEYILKFIFFSLRNSIPQSPNFPLDNQTARDHILEKVTDMFRHTFPYTTIYPSLGNLDITSSSMLNARFPKANSPYHRSRRPQRKGSNRNGHKRRGNKGKIIHNNI